MYETPQAVGRPYPAPSPVAPPHTGILDEARNRAYRQQERIISFTNELRAVADATFGIQPVPPNDAGNAKGPAPSRAIELYAAQSGVDEALDLLYREIERFRDL